MKVYPRETKKSMPHHRNLPYFLAGVFACFPLAAEPVVVVHAPTLKPGYENLQAALDQSFSSFTGDFDALIETAIAKPRLMEGFNAAAMQAILIPSVLPQNGKPYVAVGTAASFASPGLSTSFLNELDSLDAKSDFDAGLGIQPLIARLGYPLDFLVPGLSVGATAGFLDTASGTYGIQAGTAGVSAEYAAIRKQKGMIAWDGVTVGAGLNYAQYRATATIRTAAVRQSILVDPDGNGPLAAFSETVVVDPKVRAGIESTVIAVNASATTGVTLFRALSLFGGGGFAVGRATSGIALDGNGTVNITDYLSGLVQSPGTFSITGTAGEKTEIIAEGYILTGLAFRVAIFELTIPVVFRPIESVGTGVFLGVRL